MTKPAHSRVSKGIAPPAPHRTVREPLDPIAIG